MDRATTGIRYTDRPCMPQGQPVSPPGSQDIQINVLPGPQQYPPYVPYRSEVVVKERRSQGIIGMIFELIAGVILLTVIAVVLLTGLGAVMVNLNTTGGLPQPITDYSLGFYHYFFG